MARDPYRTAVGTPKSSAERSQEILAEMERIERRPLWRVTHGNAMKALRKELKDLTGKRMRNIAVNVAQLQESRLREQIAREQKKIDRMKGNY